MACDCLKKTEELLRERIVDGGISEEIGFIEVTGYGFKNKPFLVFRGGDPNIQIKTPIALEFQVKYKRKAKTTGNVREYKKEVSFFPSFCSFCGKEYEETVKKQTP